MRTRVFLILGVLILLALLGTWLFVLRPRIGGQGGIPTSSPTGQETSQAQGLSERVSPPTDPADLDGDGVPDDTEAALGTSNRRADTDGDGLSDKAEIEQWKTDPTNADTDGDGFSDLTEIANGYNPLGDGTL